MAGIELSPIGRVESPLTDPASAPKQGRRDVLRVHPRDDITNPQRGVFSTRSAHRPNPIGLHEVEVVSIDGGRVRVRNLEAVDGTPVVDVKPVICAAR
jgi:tRNA-Thr(GGU) m(6)t(6)A37 methyltransferase TsaA